MPADSSPNRLNVAQMYPESEKFAFVQQAKLLARLLKRQRDQVTEAAQDGMEADSIFISEADIEAEVKAERYGAGYDMRLSFQTGKSDLFYSYISDNQVYIYHRGHLLLKKWLHQPPGSSRVFNLPGNF